MITWDATTATYYLDGEPIDNDTLIALLDEVIDNAIATYVATLAGMYDAGFDADAWYEYTYGEIVANYAYVYMLGRGGSAQMASDDWAAVAGAVAYQLDYLDNFYADVANMSQSAVAARTALYLGAMRDTFFAGQYAAVLNSGNYSEETWILDPVAEHCPDCVVYAADGWQPLGTWTARGIFPGSGHTECLGNCRCRLEFR